jgi:transcriptional accessory protein Tex/SPT6
MEENVGLRAPSYVGEAVTRKKRLRRKREVDSDGDGDDHDGDDGGVEGAGDGDEAAKAAVRLFGVDDLSDDDDERARAAAATAGLQGDGDIDFDHGSDEDENFIEGGSKAARRKRARRSAFGVDTGVSASKLEEARKIFGDDSDIKQYLKLTTRRSSADTGADDFHDIFGAADDDDDERARQVREQRERQALLRKFEPAVLAEKHLTAADDVLKRSEVPERFARDFELQSDEHAVHNLQQLYAMVDGGDDVEVPAPAAGQLLLRRPLPSADEIKAEAAWIMQHRLNHAIDELTRPSAELRVRAVLELLRRDVVEVPFITHYKKEVFAGLLTPEQVRLVADADRDWHHLKLHRARVQLIVNAALRRAKTLLDQLLSAPEAADEVAEQVRKAAFADADAVVQRLKSDYALAAAMTTEELDDVARYCLLQQTRHETLFVIPRLQRLLKEELAKKDAYEKQILDIKTDAQYDLSGWLPPSEKTIRTTMRAAALKEPEQNLAEAESALAVARDDLARFRPLSLPGMQLDQYRRALRLGLHHAAGIVGISARELGENALQNYQTHVPHDPAETPAAIGMQLATAAQAQQLQDDANAIATIDPDDVLAGMRALLVEEMVAEPSVRRAVRSKYRAAVMLSTEPTEKGDLEIDPFHAYAPIKYLRNKPLRALHGTAQFLAVLKAAREGLITYELRVQGDHILREIQPLYLSDRVSDHARLWNDQRAMIVREAVDGRLLVQLQKELVAELTADAQRAVQRALRAQARQLFESGPYRRSNETNKPDPNDWAKTVMTFVWGGESVPTMCAVLDGNGALKDTLQLHHMYRIRTMQAGPMSTERKTAPSDLVREDQKNDDCRRIEEFVLQYRPVIIGVAVLPMQIEARDLLSDLFDIAGNMHAQEKIDRVIDVHPVDGVPARLWADSALARSEFPDQHELTRQAIAVGRRLLDPLSAFAALYADVDRPLQYLPWHPLQSELPRETLLQTLESELVDAVSNVGVDLQRVLTQPHARPLLSFVAGLGERKAAALIRAALSFDGRVLSRCKIADATAQIKSENGGGADDDDDQPRRGGKKKGEKKKPKSEYDSDDEEQKECRELVHAGPSTDLESLCEAVGGVFVWRNCVAFLRLDATLDKRDRTRVHPEDYLLMAKLAFDEFEKDSAPSTETFATAESARNQKTPAEQRLLCAKLLRNGVRLKDAIDQDGWAMWLKSERHLDKRLTINDLLTEIEHPFADPRRPYQQLGPEALFFALTGETPQSLARGVMVTATASLVGRQRVRCRLDSGVDGLLLAQDLSDDAYVESCEDRVQRNQVLHARVLEIDHTKFEVTLTTKSSLLGPDSPLVEERLRALTQQEVYLDVREAFGGQPLRLRAERRAKRAAVAGDADTLPSELNRLILHPMFKNVTFRAAERELLAKAPGAVLFRPSTKGTDFLTLTWYFTAGPPPVFVHISIREELKGENAATLGKKLTIDSTEFADFNEVLTRYVEPMNDLVRRMLAFEKFSTLSTVEAAEKLENDKRANPEAIPYLVCVSHEHHGRFELFYQPTQRKSRREIITLSTAGYRLRHKVFPTPRDLVNWFKVNWHKPIKRAQPPPTAAATTTTSSSSSLAQSQRSSASTSTPLSASLAQLSSMGPLGVAGSGDSRAHAARDRLPPPVPGSVPSWAAPVGNSSSGPSWANVRAAWMDQPPQVQPMMSGGWPAAGGGWASGGWGAPPPGPHMMPPPPPPHMMPPPSFIQQQQQQQQQQHSYQRR